MLTFEDLHVGRVFPLGPYAVNVPEIRAFANEFDPRFGGLGAAVPNLSDSDGVEIPAASPVHVQAMVMRMMCDGWLLQSSCIGSPGVTTMDLPTPVRAGNILSGQSRILSARPSKSRPDRGLVIALHSAHNQYGDPVLRMENPIFFLRRESA